LYIGAMNLWLYPGFMSCIDAACRDDCWVVAGLDGVENCPCPGYILRRLG
jgi:hypothetical protein